MTKPKKFLKKRHLLYFKNTCWWPHLKTKSRTNVAHSHNHKFKKNINPTRTSNTCSNSTIKTQQQSRWAQFSCLQLLIINGNSRLRWYDVWNKFKGNSKNIKNAFKKSVFLPTWLVKRPGNIDFFEVIGSCYCSIWKSIVSPSLNLLLTLNKFLQIFVTTYFSIAIHKRYFSILNNFSSFCSICPKEQSVIQFLINPSYPFVLWVVT